MHCECETLENGKWKNRKSDFNDKIARNLELAVLIWEWDGSCEMFFRGMFFQWNFVEEIKIVRCDCGCIFRIMSAWISGEFDVTYIQFFWNLSSVKQVTSNKNLKKMGYIFISFLGLYFLFKTLFVTYLKTYFIHHSNLNLITLHNHRNTENIHFYYRIFPSAVSLLPRLDLPGCIIMHSEHHALVHHKRGPIPQSTVSHEIRSE